METLLIDRADGVVTVTMNRPARKNAIDTTMRDELLSVFRALALSASAGDRVVVLTGAGGEFCSGADLSDPGDLLSGGLDYMRRVGDVVLALHDLPQPT